MARAVALPDNLPPLGLSIDQAAALIGVSRETFASLVREGRMPKPVPLGRRRVIWHREQVERSFAALAGQSGPRLPADPLDDWADYR